MYNILVINHVILPILILVLFQEVLLIHCTLDLLEPRCSEGQANFTSSSRTQKSFLDVEIDFHWQHQSELAVKIYFKRTWYPRYSQIGDKFNSSRKECVYNSSHMRICYSLLLQGCAWTSLSTLVPFDDYHKLTS